MNFAFLVHPLSEETRQLVELDPAGKLRKSLGQDVLSFCGQLHWSIAKARRRRRLELPDRVRVVDELGGLASARGAHVEGRLYEIPMDAMAILDDPTRAMEYMLEAVNLAADWGAKLVGLGSMTGIIGGQGTYLADHAPVPVTTGNSLTVYVALENLLHACRETGVDLQQQTVAVVGVPGSISTAAATILAPRCKSLLLVGRQRSARARRLAQQLDAELLVDIPAALGRAGVVFTATSSGDCIDQQLLRSGSIVIDVAVPTDVQGDHAQREDTLILTGGLSQVPQAMSLESNYLWFQRGMLPSCLAETTVLALEDRAECYSLGRDLQPERIEQIGELAREHGFSFCELFSFGLPLDESALVHFRKARSRRWATAGGGKPRPESAQPQRPPADPQQLAARAARLHARYVNPVLASLGAGSGFVKTFVRGKGTQLWDAGGDSYLDFVAGFGSLNVGHNHPAVVEAIGAAMQHAAPGFAQSAVNPYAAALAEELVTIAPPGMEMVFFANSGSEAVEAALKLARRVTGRDGLLYCEGSFHGKTFGSLSVTGNPEYQQSFGPLLPGCRSVPYGDLQLLARALDERRFAAFVVEPIQAEGGMIVPPEDYLIQAQRLCRRTETLLVVDEVQTGLGRTGAMFAVDELGVEPDLMTLAKSLGGGLMPIAAMLARRELWMKAYGTVQSFALHTSTFGGGSLACAAGLATLEVLQDEALAANAAARGYQLLQGLGHLCEKYDALISVRGRGLLMGLEFRRTPDQIRTHLKQVDPAGFDRYMVPNLEAMLEGVTALYAMITLLQEHRIYTQATRSNPRVVRVEPPLTISAGEVDRFLAAVDDCCCEIDFTNDLMGGVIAKSGLGRHEASRRNARPVETPPR